MDRLESGSAQYNIPIRFKVAGALDQHAFEKAINAIIERHEVLRTRFLERKNKLYQVVEEHADMALQRIDLTHLQGTAQAEEVSRLATREAQQGFELAAGRLIRASLLVLSASEHVVLITMHHIISDGWSINIFLQELDSLYTGFTHKLDNSLPPLTVQYSDYAQWQRDWMQGEVLQQQLDYWSSQLAGIPPCHDLPLDKPRAARQTFAGQSHRQDLNKAITAQIRACCQQHGVTLFMFLQTVFAVLLSRYSNARDIVMGTPIAGRTHGDTEALIGFFVNTLVLRSQFRDDPSFSQALAANKQAILDAFTHQHIPFEMLVEELQPERSLSHSPLIQILFSLHKGLQAESRLADLELSPVQLQEGIIKFDLEMVAIERSDRLILEWNYNTELFEAASITRLADGFELLLQGILEDAGQTIAQLPLLPASQQARLQTWNATEHQLPELQAVHELFEQQAASCPDAIAVVMHEARLSYVELNRRANQLAHYLRAHGIGPEQRVGVCLPQSVDLIVACLAVVKAGGVYVPLDADYPRERLAFMLADAQVAMLLTSAAIEAVAGLDVARLDLDQWDALLADYPGENPAVPVAGQNLAYIIYTSGSTGQPKGVSATHQAIIRLVRNSGYVDILASDRIAQASTVSFDAATFEIWGALLNGAQLVGVGKSELLDTAQLHDIIRQRGISITFITTALFNQIARHSPDAFKPLRYVLYGGERCDPHWVRQVLQGGGPDRLLHVYGPTEVTTFASYFPIESIAENATAVPIGKPIGNTQAYILDADLRPAPMGAVGELFLGGLGLARGYLGRYALTAATFIPHPHSTSPGALLYRTGDLARFRNDGSIDYVGRRDHQIKMRGFRIELGEIESRLEEQPGVAMALVKVLDGELGQQLVAYVAGSSDLSEATLKAALQQALPAYMMPLVIMLLESFPLNANGKVDRPLLPEPVWDDYRQQYVAARNATEQQLAKIFQDLLQLEQVGIDDNFFALGGHSLLATQLISQVRQQLDVELPLREFFEQPTIRGLTTAMQAHHGELVLPTIRRADREQPLRLSFAQQRLWFIDQMDGGSTQYNMPLAYRLSGRLDQAAFRQAVDSMVARHEVLRTHFVVSAGETYQVIKSDFAVPLEIIDLSELEEMDRQQALQHLLAADIQRRFDLSKDLMLSVQVIRLAADEHVVLSNMHHIVADGWSLGIFFRELSLLYQAYSEGSENPLTPLALQYADYAQWQRDWLRDEVLAQQLSYWRRQLAGIPPLHGLPLDHPRPARPGYRGRIYQHRLSQSLTEAVGRFCEQHDVTLFMFLQTAFALLLSRYSNERDIVIGTPIAGRNHGDCEPLIGFFVNTLVLRSQLSGNPGFLQLLAANRQMILDAYTHQHIPFEMLVEELQPERTPHHSPIFQILFTLQNNVHAQPDFPGLRLSSVRREHHIIKFDLELSASQRDAGLLLSWNYSTELFAAASIERLADSYEVLLEGILAHPEQSLAALPVLSRQARMNLQSWNATHTELPAEAGLQELFEQQVSATPDAVAVSMGGHSLSYRELNRRANQLAHYLRERGVELEQRVGVCLPHGVELIVAFVAIVKAGGVYVPLDVDYPPERLAFMLADAQVRLLLSSATQKAAAELQAEIIDLNDWEALLAGYPVDNLSTANSRQSLAYIIYTSGSTGQPKGVCATHQAVIRLVKNCHYIEISSSDRIAQASTVSFDAATFEIWGALLNGARLVGVPRDALLNPEQLRLTLRQQGISVTFLTTALFNQIAQYAADAFQSLRVVLYGGERCDAHIVRQVLAAGGPEHLLHVYGPTEVTTFSSYFPVTAIAESDSTVPIGKPIGNTHTHVLDDAGNQVPVGVVGELYLGGIGVARGYLDRRALTAQRFVPDPFSGQPGARLYRTGDLVRYRPDGEIEFMGRVDHQVKLRGFRIELGEIESRLEAQADVDAALVQVLESEQGQQLVAYVAAAGAVTEADLKTALRRQLPGYMIPLAIVVLPAFPLTANGKVDRQALPTPIWEDYLQQYVAPRNPIEQQLAALFTELLPVDQLGIDDNFFELGGHSLLATRLISRVRQVLDTELPLRELFEHPTVRALAAVLRAHQDELVLPRIEPVDRSQPLMLSYAQQRLWFIDQLEGGSSQYNMPMVYELNGPLNPTALQQSLGMLVQRHEVLRTRFIAQAGEARQVINADASVPLPRHDLSDLNSAAQQQEIQRLSALDAGQPFDLSSDLMLRVQLLKLADEEHLLLCNMHHIASDGWSMGVFVAELSRLYAACLQGRDNPLTPLPVQYADYAQWQREWLRGEVLAAHLAYWQGQLAELPPVHGLPLDQPRPAQQTFNGQRYLQRLDGEVLAAVKTLCQRHDVTLFMLLQTAFAALLSRYSNEQDIVIGTPIAGRTQAETEGLIGFFVNTLVLRSRFDQHGSFRQVLLANKQTILEAYTHQHIPFEMLVQEVQPERNLRHSPVFQILFSLQNTEQSEARFEGLTSRLVPPQHSIIKFDLELFAIEREDGLVLAWNYNTDLFAAASVERLAASYQVLLEAVLADIDQPLVALPILPAAEQARLDGWNDSTAELPVGSAVQHLFEQQAALSPEAIAVVAGDQRLDYAAVNARANQLAHYLLAEGIGAEQRVGVCMRRSAQLPVVLLAILKAGAAYVPLDPEYPSERLEFMLRDAQASCLLTDGALSLGAPLSGDGLTVISLSELPLDDYPSGNPELVIAAQQLAYVIYTSGSTGLPKGVAISHASCVAMLAWAARQFTPEALRGVLASTSICFDLSVYELFVPLSTGGQVVLTESALSLLEFAQWDQVSLVNTVPSAIEAMVSVKALPDSVRVVNLAGEALSRQTVEKVYQHSSIERLYNLYGPSEDTTYSTGCWVPAGADDTPAIGRPVANSQAYILDAQLQRVPVGVVGELYMGGLGLARGYLGRPGLTAERFVPDPYGGQTGARLYGTGDLARYRPDGQIDYMGRVDHQVKIRGFRIELGEIESLLELQAGVEAAIVQVLTGELGQQLVAYVMSDDPLSERALKTALQRSLPDYMVPLAIIRLARFPLTANGKVDRKALPAPVWDDYRQQYVAPRNDTEQQLARIYQQQLQLEQVGIDDNFFALGGHSLLATRLISRIRETLQVELPLRQLFEQPTIRGLSAALLDHQDEWVLTRIEPADRDQPLALSYAQQRLWFIDRLEGGSSQYNMPMAYRLTGSLDTAALQRAVAGVIERHEVLRTHFIEEAGEPCQVIRQEFSPPVENIDLSGLEAAQQSTEVQRRAALEAQRPFDLSRDLMLRVQLLKLADQQHVVLLSMHHIASDGWSMGLLFSELRELYQAYSTGRDNPLPALTVQYADYAQWQRDWLRDQVLARQLAYWQTQLADIPPVHSLPLDQPRPPEQSFSGEVFHLLLDQQMQQAIKQFCRQQDVTLFMFLQTAFALLISRYSNEQDIVMGTPIAGRSHGDTEALIGFFVNTLVLRNQFAGNPSFTEALTVNKQTILDAYTHQHIPFEMLLEKLKPERSLRYSPVFQIFFTMQNNRPSRPDLPGLQFNLLQQPHTISKFDLELFAEERDDGISLAWIYNQQLFLPTSIERLAGHFRILLSSILSTPEQGIHSLNMLSDAEREQLLLEWGGSTADYPVRHGMHQLFERQVEKTPDAIALRFDRSQISYRRLNQSANRLAHYLRAQGVKQGALIAVCTERSVEMIVAVLGVLKAGAAYVPVDPAYPAERVSYMLQDCGAGMLLTHSRLLERLPLSGQQVLCLDTQDTHALLHSLSTANPAQISAVGDQPAYVIYTSGSTGKPKGVVGLHRGMVNRVNWLAREFPIKSGEVFCQKTSISFVDHIAEIFQPLAAGIALTLLSNDDVNDVDALISTLAVHKISRITLVPSLLKLLLETEQVSTLRRLRYIISSGETLPLAAVRQACARLPQARLINLYGSSEVSADVTYYPVDLLEYDDILKYFYADDSDIFNRDGASINLEKQAILPAASVTRPDVNLSELYAGFSDSDMPSQPVSMNAYVDYLKADVLPYAINVSSDLFVGHMTSALPNFVPEFGKLITHLNQNLVKIETSKSVTLLERQVLAILHRLFYRQPAEFYDQYCQDPGHAFGVITSGGTSSNITALWCARNKGLIQCGVSKQQIVQQGVSSVLQQLGYRQAVIIGSRLAHYSIKKAASLLGIGESNIIIPEQDSDQKVSIEDLERCVIECRNKQQFVIAIVGMGGATETGTVDRLHEMARIASRYQIHFHVDAAWGSAFVFSEKYRHILRGIEQADSITLCPHKQFFLPQGISLCLYKDTQSAFATSTNAKYQAQQGSFDMGQFTLEGSRPAHSLMVHASLHLFSRQGYAWLIHQSMEKTRYFKQLIERSGYFQLVGRSDINIVNYRYIPSGLRHQSVTRFNQTDTEEINAAVELIQNKQFLRGRSFVSRTTIVDSRHGDQPLAVFRVVLFNPTTSREDLIAVLEDQLSIAAEFIEQGASFALRERIGMEAEAGGEAAEEFAVPIGRPIDDSKVYILNQQQALVPVGVVGELCVAGAGLAAGYLHNEELSQTRFIRNPYANDPSERLFRTGDLARWLPDGNIMYMGRSDHQVKVRGFRIELGEIEYQLQQQAGIEQAVVQPFTDESGQQLAAYVVSDGQLSEAQIKAALSEVLPDYMVPMAVLLLDALPLTANGKLNRQALPKPDRANYQQVYAAPRNATETLLCGIWQQLLGLERVGIEDNFFALGGHSLLATRLISQIRQQLEVELPLRVLFEQQTIAGLAAALPEHHNVTVLTDITPAERAGPLQLSYAQQRLWFIDQLESGGTQYNMPMAYRLRGALNIQALEQTLYLIIERHEVLRTRFVEQAGQVTQVIREQFSASLASHDLSQLDAARQNREIRRLAIADATRPFDLSRDLLLRMQLLRLADDDYVLLTNMHHIASDGWSLGLLFKEISALYQACHLGQDNPLPALPLQYVDYAQWQRNWLQGEVLEQQLSYWRRQLADIPPVHSLPLDYPRPPEQTFAGRIHNQFLDAALSDAIHVFCRTHDVTLFMFLQTAFAVLISRYSNAQDIVIGTPIAGRTHSDTEALIGFFVNSLALRTRLDQASPFDEVLSANRQTILDAYNYQHIPFEMLVESIQPERTLQHSPVYQLSFSVQNNAIGSIEIPDLSITGMTVDGVNVIKFDLQLLVAESAEQLQLNWTFNTDLFAPARIERLSASFAVLLDGIIRQPRLPVGDLALLDESEQQRLLRASSGVTLEYPREQYFHQQFEAQVARNPEASAVVSAEQILSYAQLNARANQLAHYLLGQQLGPGSLVAICMQRSPQLLVSLLAVLKAGAAYVPIDPGYPAQRIAKLVSDAGAGLLLTQTALRAKAPEHIALLCLDELKTRQRLSLEHQGNPSHAEHKPDIDRLAYVIYTSGSTGQPKGVKISHRGLNDYCAFALDEYYAPRLDGAWVVTSHAFDITVPSLYLPLLRGDYVELAPPDIELESLAEVLQQADAANYLLRMTPVHVSGLLVLLGDAAASQAEHVFVIGGAQLTYAVASRLAEKFPRASYYNHYGPTETTVGCALHAISPAELNGSHRGAVPIGRPMANTCLYVLDQRGQLAPPGVPGELYIGSQGVSLGYLHDEELTRACFVPSRFAANPGQLLYRSGDIVRWLPDGQLEFIGRADDQLKLRGFRIELGEIENCLNQQAGIRSAAVVAVGDESGKQQLAAYIVPVGLTVESVAMLTADARQALLSGYKEYMQQRLPEYMLPTLFMLLDRMPLTASGKIDRKALPAPGEDALIKQHYVPPETPAETQLCAIWQQLLGVAQVGVSDNFFELGGDSIISIQLVSSARQAGLALTVRDVFTHQTVRALARTAGQAQQAAAEQSLISGPVALTPIQRRFAAADFSTPQHWNMSMLFRLPADVDGQTLRQVLDALLRQHDALRLYYPDGDWSAQAIAAEAGPAVLREVDLSDYPPALARTHWQRICAEIHSSVELSSGNLMRACVVRLPDAEVRLLLVIHHLAVDGISWRILQEDLRLGYQQLEQSRPLALPAKTHSFQAWSEHLQQCVTGGLLAAELEYWQRQAAQVRPLYQQREGGNLVRHSRVHSVQLPAASTEQLLRQVNQAYRTEINDLLLAALLLSYSRWAQTDSVSLDMEGHGRELLGEGLDVARTVGWFTTRYPLTLRQPDNIEPGQLSMDESLMGQLLMSVKEQLRAVPNKGIGYGLLRYLHADEQVRSSLQPAVPVALSFNYLGQFQHTGGSAAFDLAPEGSGANQAEDQTRAELLSVVASVSQGRLQVNCQYSSECYSDTAIEQFCSGYLAALSELIRHCVQPGNVGRTPSDYPLCRLTQTELDQLTTLLQLERGDAIDDIYPLSSVQQGTLFHSQAAAQSGHYVIQLGLRLQDLDSAAFRRAWQQLLDSHRILRTVFVGLDGEQPLQLVLDHAVLPWQEHDWSELSADQQQSHWQELLAADRRQGFEPSQAPLMRAYLVSLGNAECRFLWSHHHALMDGWSSPLLFRDLLSAYQGQVAEQPVTLRPEVEFADYIAWLRQQDEQQARSFWRGHLQHLSAPTPLLFGDTSARRAAGRQAELETHLTVAASDRLQQFCKQQRVTLNTLLQAGWGLLLSRYSGETEVGFGTTVSGRPAELSGVGDIIGPLINTLPVAMSIARDLPVTAFLQQVQQAHLQREQYGYLALTDIQQCSAIAAGAPLFESLLVFENYPVPQPHQAPSGTARPAMLKVIDAQAEEQTHYPITLIVALSDEQLQIRMYYDADRFNAASMQRLVAHYQLLLDAISHAASEPLQQLSLLSPAEQTELQQWNATRTELPAEASVQALFERQVSLTPDTPAVIMDQQTLSYAQLNQRANRLAHYLLAQGVTSETCVGVCMPRRPELIIALLAILKAGGAYVPLDPDYPLERLEFMLADADIKLLLSAGDTAMTEALPVNTLELTALADELAEYPDSNPASGVSGDNLAYVIYTSGSTGQPKGVGVCHANIRRLLCGVDYLQFDSSMRMLQAAPVAFDASTLEIWGPLLHGGSCILLPVAVPDSGSLKRVIAAHQVNSMWLTSALFNALIEESAECLSGLKQLAVGGEAVSAAHVARLYAVDQQVRIINGYGPTESTTFACCYPIPRNQPEHLSVPIGNPIGNTQAYIVDPELRQVPVGVTGELYLAGQGLARGYLTRPLLTSAAFMPNPFSARPGARMYRTGDLARYRSDGSIEYVGRTDDQVKVRGFRIELGEVASQLEQQPGVQEALVQVLDSELGQQLVAYVAAESAVSEQTLKSALRQSLPGYMVPLAIVVLESFPLTANGKLDRQALPSPAWDDYRQRYVAPSNDIEQQLAAIYARLLQLEQVGIHDNFFELGGHSLLATRLINQIRQAFAVELPLEALFAQPTIAELGKSIDTLMDVRQSQENLSRLQDDESTVSIKL